MLCLSNFIPVEETGELTRPGRPLGFNVRNPRVRRALLKNSDKPYKFFSFAFGHHANGAIRQVRCIAGNADISGKNTREVPIKDPLDSAGYPAFDSLHK